jgi:hypothetical protein
MAMLDTLGVQDETITLFHAVRFLERLCQQFVLRNHSSSSKLGLYSDAGSAPLAAARASQLLRNHAIALNVGFPQDHGWQLGELNEW